MKEVGTGRGPPRSTYTNTSSTVTFSKSPVNYFYNKGPLLHSNGGSFPILPGS